MNKTNPLPDDCITLVSNKKITVVAQLHADEQHVRLCLHTPTLISNVTTFGMFEHEYPPDTAVEVANDLDYLDLKEIRDGLTKHIREPDELVHQTFCIGESIPEVKTTLQETGRDTTYWICELRPLIEANGKQKVEFSFTEPAPEFQRWERFDLPLDSKAPFRFIDLRVLGDFGVKRDYTPTRVRLSLHPWAHPQKAWRRLRRQRATQMWMNIYQEIGMLGGVVEAWRVDRLKEIPEVAHVEVVPLRASDKRE